MEKKERYELIGYCSYRDTETGVIGDNFAELLNQQDAKIKELEDMVIDKQNKLYSRLDKIKELQEEKQQLKQLHNLPKKIVEEIRTYCNLKEFNPEFVDKEHQECIVSYTELIDILDTILKKYGGEDESKWFI